MYVRMYVRTYSSCSTFAMSQGKFGYEKLSPAKGHYSSIRNMQQGKIVVSSYPAPIFCPVHSQFREYTVVAHTANLHNCVGVCWATSDEDY